MLENVITWEIEKVNIGKMYNYRYIYVSKRLFKGFEVKGYKGYKVVSVMGKKKLY